MLAAQGRPDARRSRPRRSNNYPQRVIFLLLHGPRRRIGRRHFFHRRQLPLPGNTHRLPRLHQKTVASRRRHQNHAAVQASYRERPVPRLLNLRRRLLSVRHSHRGKTSESQIQPLRPAHRTHHHHARLQLGHILIAAIKRNLALRRNLKRPLRAAGERRRPRRTRTHRVSAKNRRIRRRRSIVHVNFPHAAQRPQRLMFLRTRTRPSDRGSQQIGNRKQREQQRGKS